MRGMVLADDNGEDEGDRDDGERGMGLGSC